MLTKHAALQIYGLGQIALTTARSNIVWSDRVRKNAEGMEHGLAETPVVNVSQLANYCSYVELTCTSVQTIHLCNVQYRFISRAAMCFISACALKYQILHVSSL